MLNDLLRQHDGVITLSQALDCGLSRSAISRRVQSGHWQRYAQGVYHVTDQPFTPAAAIRAAVWSYGPHATASGLAAAWWHQLTPKPPSVIEVTLPRNSHGRPRPGTRVRRRDLRPDDVVEHRELRLTTMELTAIEAAVRPGGGARIMDSALQRHTELPHLWRAHMRNTGRYGSPRSRILLQAAGDGARSQAERLLVRILTAAGITGWRTNYPIGPYKVDFAFAESKVILEVDGWAFHSSVEDFENDRVRQNYLMLLGWTILRFTWSDLNERPDYVVAEVRRAISAR